VSVAPYRSVPNALTLARIALIPALALVFYLPWRHAGPAAALVFLLGAATDWLDGYLARRLRQGSPFGRFLDPVADKLLVAAALVLLVESYPRALMTLPALVIIAREITVSALREWMAEVGQGIKLTVTTVAKFKTGVQMAAVALLLWREPLAGLPTVALGLAALYFAVGLTLWSMSVYLRAAWPSLKGVDTPCRAPEESAPS
jgi:CDP-diacylglycerol--glycerol-3-phosphate 3-phosphatidyltransferase